MENPRTEISNGLSLYELTIDDERSSTFISLFGKSSGAGQNRAKEESIPIRFCSLVPRITIEVWAQDSEGLYLNEQADFNQGCYKVLSESGMKTCSARSAVM